MSFMLRAVMVSDRGLRREINEDSAYAGTRLVAVADGMGGLPAGEVASEIVIRALAPLDSVPAEGHASDLLLATVWEANRAVRAVVEKDPAVTGMGTTLTALLLDDEAFALIHIGDSRAYLLRDNELQQVTRDDTYVQGLVDRGVLAADEVWTHPRRSLITQAVQGGKFEPTQMSFTACVDDRIMLCSDGLSDVVDHDTIGHTLREHADSRDCGMRLIKHALDAGGPDNITVVIADVCPDPAH